MHNNVVIIGAGGHAKVIRDILVSRHERLLGFIDDHVSGTFQGRPILGNLKVIPQYSEMASFIIGIGDNAVRAKIANSNSINWYTALHPNAVISSSVEIGEGSAVMAQAVLNPDAVIGRHCIINTGAVVEHDCVIGDYVHVSPHATLCGTVHIGNNVHIGAGTVVKNNVSICSGCVVGAGAVVIHNILQAGTYVGVPAKRVYK